MSKVDRELEEVLHPLGVQVESTAEEEENENEHHKAPLLVVSLYDKHDAAIWKLLQQHINVLIRHYGNTIRWHTYEVQNETWLRSEVQRNKMIEQLQQAHLILLGMSIDLLDTLYGKGNFLYDVLASLHPPYSWPNSYLFPIILRTISLKHVELKMLNRAPCMYDAIAGAKNKDAACVEVTTHIERAIETIVRLFGVNDYGPLE
jgi:hypothetical protein